MRINVYTPEKRMLEHCWEIMYEMVNIQEGDEYIPQWHWTQMAEARSVPH